MYDTSDIRKNLKVILDGAPCVVIDFQFVKPGKGQAFTRTKLRNMLTGNVLERTFKSGEKLQKADLEVRQMTFLYPEGDRYVHAPLTRFLPPVVRGRFARRAYAGRKAADGRGPDGAGLPRVDVAERLRSMW